MAWTALDTIKRALRLCGAYAAGEAPSAAVGQIALEALNAMRAQWTARGIICYGTTSITVTADGSQTYQFGTGGDNATRPQQPLQVTWAQSGQDPYLLDPRTWDEYLAAAGTSDTGTPAAWAWDGAFPTANLAVWPRPSNGTIRVTMRTPFADLANVSTIIPDPPEYREAMEYGLAVRLSPEIMGTDVPATVADLAATTFRALIRRNATLAIPDRWMPPAFGLTTSGEGDEC